MRQYLTILLFAATLFMGCKPETIPDIGEPSDKLKLVEGNWQLEKVIQADLNAIKYGFPYKEMDVTNKAPFSEFKITFTLNNGAPATFTTTPGGSPKIIPLPSGSWKVDNPDVPKKFTLVYNQDTVRLNLASYNTLSNGQLKLQVIRGLDGKDLLRYDYYFKKL